jgi:hypothetical protein
MSGLSYNSSLLATIQQTEDAYAGSITNNPLLTDKFKTTYGQLVGDIKDDEAAAAGTTETAGTQAPVVTTEVKQPPKNATVTDTGVIKFETVADRDAAVEAGTIPLNARVKVGDGPIVPFTPPPSYEPVDTSMTDTSSLEGVADASGMSVEDINASKADKARRQTQESAEVIGGASGTVADWLDRNILGRSVGSFNDLVSTITSGFAWGLDQAGLEGLADGLYTAAYDMSEGAENMRKMGFFENALNSVQSGEYTESDWIEAAAEFVVDNMPDQPGMPTVKDIIEGKENGAKIKEVLASSYDSIVNLEGVPAIPQNVGGEDLDAALQRLPDHVEKLGEQGMDAWRKLTATVPTEAPKSYTQEEILAWYENRVNTQEKADMEERIRDDARQFLQDEKSFPQPLPRIVIDTLADDVVEEAKVDREVTRVVQQLNNKGETPSPKDIEDLKTTLELNQEIDTSTDELYRGPISGKTLVEKLDDIWNFYTSEESEYDPRAVGTVGFRDLGLRDTTDDVRPPRGEAPDRAASLARGASPEEDDLPAEMPRNMAVENFTTRGINATPRGLMTPNRESAPKLGQAEFGDLIQRVHGSSKAAEAFNKKVSSGKLTAADVTRLLKATRKLPETSSRQRLIMSLFNLRDGLNKR